MPKIKVAAVFIALFSILGVLGCQPKSDEVSNDPVALVRDGTGVPAAENDMLLYPEAFKFKSTFGELLNVPPPVLQKLEWKAFKTNVPGMTLVRAKMRLKPKAERNDPPISMRLFFTVFPKSGRYALSWADRTGRNAGSGRNVTPKEAVNMLNEIWQDSGATTNAVFSSMRADLQNDETSE